MNLLSLSPSNRSCISVLLSATIQSKQAHSREEGNPHTHVIYLQFPGVTVQLVNDEQPKPKPQPPPRIYDVSGSFLSPSHLQDERGTSFCL